MKINDIVIQLIAKATGQTSMFSDDLSVTSISVAGTVATVVTASAHGLLTGRPVSITGAENTVAITSISRADDIATVVTTTDHDLTLSLAEKRIGRRNPSLAKTVTLSGATEPQFNGSFTLLSVNNRRKFTMKVSDSGAVSATGTPILYGGRAYSFNTLYSVSSVINPTSFTITLPSTNFSSTASTLGSIVARVKPRITGAVTIERAVKAYTDQADNAIWLFVVPTPSSVSKNRFVHNDTTDTRARNDDYRQKRIDTFSVYAFFNTSNELAAVQSYDKVDDVSKFLYKSLCGASFSVGLCADNQYLTTYVGSSPVEYNTAIYIHQFDFEQVTEITMGDAVEPSFSVAARDFDISILMPQGTQQDPALLKINLDEEPL